jgi:hypothetical protein
MSRTLAHDIWYCEDCLCNIFPFNNIENDIEFKNCIFTYSHCNNVNADIIHNTSQLQLCNRLKLCQKDIDPDKYLFNQSKISNDMYYLEDTFSHLIENQFAGHNFSLIHLNIRSLPKNKNLFLAYLSQLHHRFSVIALTETRATDDNEGSLNIPGYNNIFANRKTSSGGGVALFVHEDFSFELRKDCNFSTNSPVNSLFINITGSKISKKNNWSHIPTTKH